MSNGGVVGDFGPGEIELPPGAHNWLDPEDPQYVVSVGEDEGDPRPEIDPGTAGRHEA